MVDDDRQVLYSLSAKGFVEVFDLGPTGEEDMRHIDRQSVFQLAEEFSR